MTLQLSSASFRRAVTLAGKAVERRNTIPILGMIHCRANGSFQATGTDLDLTVTAEVDREPGETVDFVMDAHRQVLSALAAAGGDAVSASYDGGKVSLVSDALNLRISTLPVDDFPSELSRPLASELSATFSRSDIAQIARVAGAMSTEETRYYLNGIAFEKTGDTTIRVAATDGHRLYWADIEAPDLAGSVTGISIVPRKLVDILVDLSRTATDGIRIEMGPQAPTNRPESTAPERSGMPRFAASLTTGGARVRLCGKLIDGTYPDYRRVIPREPGKQALFQVADLRRAVAAISGQSKNMRAAKLTFHSEGLTVSSAYVDIGLSTTIAVPCQHRLDGYEIGFNGNYLASLLDSAAGDEIVFEFGSTSDPVLIRNPADTSWGAVLMPMRV